MNVFSINAISTDECTCSNGNEFRTRWPVVLACFICITFSIGPIVSYSFGILVPDIMKEFGWSRAEVLRGITAHNIGILIGAPLIGVLIDRFSARLVILLAIPVFALLWSSLSFLGHAYSLWHFYAVLVLIPIVAGGVLPMSYSRLIVQNFTELRGLALGIALAGTGFGATILPIFIRFLVDHHSLSTAYAVIGCGAFVATFFIAFFFLHDTENDTKSSDAITAKKQASADNFWEILFSERMFWIMSIMVLLTGFAITAMLINFVPIVTELGMSQTSAAFAASVLGLAVLFGRLLIGFLFDRVFAPYVTVVVLLAPVAACVLLTLSPGVLLIYVSAILLGIAIGAETDIMVYLTSRYFAPNYFGVISGLMFALFVGGGALGPLALGYLHELQGNYFLSLRLMAGVIFAGAICVLFSPKYRYD
nr:MFS transporter [Pseudomaricurvus alkylphenolicus]